MNQRNINKLNKLRNQIRNIMDLEKDSLSGLKTCRTCKVSQSVNQYNLNNKKTGPGAKCKTCVKKKNLAYYIKTKARRKAKYDLNHPKTRKDEKRIIIY